MRRFAAHHVGQSCHQLHPSVLTKSSSNEFALNQTGQECSALYGLACRAGGWVHSHRLGCAAGACAPKDCAGQPAAPPSTNKAHVRAVPGCSAWRGRQPRPGARPQVAHPGPCRRPVCRRAAGSGETTASARPPPDAGTARPRLERCGAGRLEEGSMEDAAATAGKTLEMQHTLLREGGRPGSTLT